MKTTTHLLLTIILTGSVALPAAAQEASRERMETHIKINVSKDGKTLSRSYSSEEEMNEDKELQEFMGEDGVIVIHTDKEEMITGNGNMRQVRVIRAGDEKKKEEIIIHGDKDKDSKSQVIEYGNKVIMVEKGEGKTVEVYRFSDEDELPEDIRQMIEERNVAVIMGEKADRNEIVKRGKRIYPEPGGFLSALDYDVDLKSNELSLSFEAEAVPTDIKVTDDKGKELFKETLKNFDGSYQKKIQLKRLKSPTLLLLIEQNGEVREEKIDLDY
ncbi:hypothetical protein AB9P05_10305 [Roseivirga sp. BDSF3-8]|uniref:hypothetical protein n=1 Tax=Roseivirga sp. BDSF3-8 TaxID=3241598 RepID=UPI003531969D